MVGLTAVRKYKTDQGRAQHFFKDVEGHQSSEMDSTEQDRQGEDIRDGARISHVGQK